MNYNIEPRPDFDLSLVCTTQSFTFFDTTRVYCIRSSRTKFTTVVQREMTSHACYMIVKENREGCLEFQHGFAYNPALPGPTVSVLVSKYYLSIRTKMLHDSSVKLETDQALTGAALFTEA